MPPYDSQSTKVQLQPAYILNSKKYRETSLILEVLTKEFGKVSILAKGVRQNKSKTAGLLQLFTLLNISFVGRTELKTLSYVELLQLTDRPQGISLYCGFYLNELISVLLPYLDPYPEIFALYRDCLKKLLNKDDIEHALRLFELNLLQHLGYGLQFENDFETKQLIVASKRYQFDPLQGPSECKDGFISGSTLLALQKQQLTTRQIFIETKKLMRKVIDFHLEGRELKSRALIANVLNQIKN
jgi:DNA repair protein RecO (recombination protein O)